MPKADRALEGFECIGIARVSPDKLEKAKWQKKFISNFEIKK